MAHSARSKSKLRAKSTKINAANGDYVRVAEERRQRLAAKTKEHLIQQKAKKGEEIVDQEAKMDVEDEDKKKVTASTSGWRKSRSSNYKKGKASKRKNKTMKF